jgi:hypothetical protein
LWAALLLALLFFSLTLCNNTCGRCRAWDVICVPLVLFSLGPPLGTPHQRKNFPCARLVHREMSECLHFLTDDFLKSSCLSVCQIISFMQDSLSLESYWRYITWFYWFFSDSGWT